MIVSIGNRNNAVDAQTGKQILREFVNLWSDRNFNLELIGVYYYADEEGFPLDKKKLKNNASLIPFTKINIHISIFNF